MMQWFNFNFGCVYITPEKFENRRSTGKKHKMFSVHTRQSPSIILDLCFEENSVRVIAWLLKLQYAKVVSRAPNNTMPDKNNEIETKRPGNNKSYKIDRAKK